jgi:hypothetical protein
VERDSGHIQLIWVGPQALFLKFRNWDSTRAAKIPEFASLRPGYDAGAEAIETAPMPISARQIGWCQRVAPSAPDDKLLDTHRVTIPQQVMGFATAQPILQATGCLLIRLVHHELRERYWLRRVCIAQIVQQSFELARLVPWLRWGYSVPPTLAARAAAPVYLFQR